jgi:hypothetical protein
MVINLGVGGKGCGGSVGGMVEDGGCGQSGASGRMGGWLGRRWWGGGSGWGSRMTDGGALFNGCLVGGCEVCWGRKGRGEFRRFCLRAESW